jgi:hypothetical protein
MGERAAWQKRMHWAHLGYGLLFLSLGARWGTRLPGSIESGSGLPGMWLAFLEPRIWVGELAA